MSAIRAIRSHSLYCGTHLKAYSDLDLNLPMSNIEPIQAVFI